MSAATRLDQTSKNEERNLKNIHSSLIQTGQDITAELAATLIYTITRQKPHLARHRLGREIIKACQQKIKGTMWDQVLYGPKETREDKELMRKLGVDT